MFKYRAVIKDNHLAKARNKYINAANSLDAHKFALGSVNLAKEDIVKIMDEDDVMVYSSVTGFIHKHWFMTDVELNFADVRAVLDIINLMSSRGAIKGQELAVIGGVYNKYLNVIEKIKEKQDSLGATVEPDSTRQ